jgi:DNA-binding transcriptional LysR family regulator
VRVNSESGTTAYLSERVAGGALDFAICAEVSNDPRLAFDPIFQERVGVLVPASHELAKKEHLTIADLQQVPLLFSDTNCRYRRVFENSVERRGAALSPLIEMSSVSARLRSVQIGLGIALVPSTALHELPPNTVFKTIEGAAVNVTLGLVRRNEPMPDNRALGSLVSLMRKRLHGRLPAPARRRARQPVTQTRGVPS